MNTNSNREILETKEGLQLAIKEAESIKDHVKNSVKQFTLKIKTPYHILTRENKYRICDIKFNGYTLLIQFYQGFDSSVKNSYLRFAIMKGNFDDNGHADLFYPIKELKSIILDFDYSDNEFGWRNKEGNDEFYNSKKITEWWVWEFFEIALNEKIK